MIGTIFLYLFYAICAYIVYWTLKSYALMYKFS
jgi:hypothetical protein